MVDMESLEMISVQIYVGVLHGVEIVVNRNLSLYKSKQKFRRFYCFYL